METPRARRLSGRFAGVRRNADTVPRLPASSVARFLRDPRGIPYVVLWTDPETNAIIRVARLELGAWEEPDPARPKKIQLRDLDGDVGLELIRAPMPLGHGESLFLGCFDCDQPRRNLYAAGIHDEADWLCRGCSRLRYSSEGQYVGNRAWNIGIESPDPWDPLVYSSPRIAAEAHGTTIEAEPLLQGWFLMGTAPLRPRIRVPESPLQQSPPALSAPPAPRADRAPDWNAIAMRARMTGAAGPADSLFLPARPRSRGW